MTETTALFVVGTLLTVINLLMTAILTYLLVEIRRLQDKVSTVEGAVGFVQGFLQAKGVIDASVKKGG